MKFYPYEPLRPLGERIYLVRGSWKRSPLGRKMVVIQLSGGGLVLHSPIALRENDLQQLEEIGEIQYLVIPNVFHGSDAAWYAEKYPQAKVVCSDTAVAKWRSQVRIDLTTAELPTDFLAEIEIVSVRGTSVGETAFFHQISRTLILTDTVFNMPTTQGISGWVFRLADIQGFGPSRLFRRWFTKDREKLRKSLHQILKWNFEKVVPGHGDLLEKDAKRSFEDAFSYLLGSA